MTELGQHRIQSFAFVVSVGTAFVFSCILVSNLIGYEPADKGIEFRLNNRINPNNASVASMARLPGIGIAKAEAIVAYRNNIHDINAENQPFKSANDLQLVKGIGPKTVENISEWLKFE